MSVYALGLDYGSDSVRALLVDTKTGEEVATQVAMYPRWGQGLYCVLGRNQFRQHPLDYLEPLVTVVQGLWAEAPAGAADKVVGISFDTTGSTPVAVDEEGVALALKPEFADRKSTRLNSSHVAISYAVFRLKKKSNS